MQSVSCANEFDVHENKPIRGTHFHVTGFAGNSEMAYWKTQGPLNWKLGRLR